MLGQKLKYSSQKYYDLERQKEIKFQWDLLRI